MVGIWFVFPGLVEIHHNLPRFLYHFSQPAYFTSCRFFSQSVSSVQISGVVLPWVFNYQFFGNFGDSGNSHPTPAPVFVPY
ncbi:MAG TPA: hypothetical protein VKU42_12675, partial [Candidatus Angelobacter sp.]|nr:hypothetical protein [Candidatus Angelobacter sp.]